MKHLTLLLTFIFIFPGCSKNHKKKVDWVKQQCNDAYTPADYKLRTNKRHPINPNVVYSRSVNEFYLWMREGKFIYYIIYNGNRLDLYIRDESKKKDSIILTDLSPKKYGDGVDDIYNFMTGNECYDFMHPYCDKQTLKRANELFFSILKKVEFNKHLKYFNDSNISGSNILDGWN